MYAFMAQHLGLDLSSIQNQSGETNKSFIIIQPYNALKAFEV